MTLALCVHVTWDVIKSIEIYELEDEDGGGAMPTDATVGDKAVF